MGIALGASRSPACNQNESNFLGIEDSAYLLQTRHPQTVRFVDHDERRRIADLHVLDDVLFGKLTVGRMEFGKGK